MNNATQQSLTILETLTTNGMLPTAQAAVIKAALRGEEAEFFVKKLAEISAIFDGMPKPYESNGQKDPIVSLRYFGGGSGEALIIERDETAEQHQAFGLCDLFGDGGELGYLSIPEMTESGWELDLHFTPKPLSEARKQ
jgi:hypothetical protein